MDTAHFLIYALAVWRISSLFTVEEGPKHIFENIRERVGIEHDDDGHIFMIPNTFLSGVFSCIWCFSVWAGIGMTAFWLVSPQGSFYFALPFALSAFAIGISRVVNK